MKRVLMRKMLAPLAVLGLTALLGFEASRAQAQVFVGAGGGWGFGSGVVVAGAPYTFATAPIATYGYWAPPPVRYTAPYSYWASFPNPARQYVGYGQNDFAFYGRPYGHPYDLWTWPYMSSDPYGILARYYYPPLGYPSGYAL